MRDPKVCHMEQEGMIWDTSAVLNEAVAEGQAECLEHF